ncbi:MAG: pyruvate ferredoxin oxidoreductase [Gemmatimonadetes bacterium]|nr:pyruvate ferredoxin oxidoreductase [Gemmatimonadota bacterium]NNK61883.1 pyruvate ferredoxin oxidoreductase [Gemmatimonadota bacterium]
MPLDVVTGNHAAGHALSLAGEANRVGRGTACGIYPITPQTEIVERVAAFPFSRGRVVAVESEHSAMGVTMGASASGARAFTASSSNGLAYMVENIMVAGFYRLPIVMVAVNRTLGPPWNIWADQGDTLMLRDFPWVQLYAADNQQVHDLTLLAFRLAEDPRILLPVLVCMDAFIVSHTQAETELASQAQVDDYLPALNLPHRLDPSHPRALGSMVWPAATVSHRKEIDEAMARVPTVIRECRSAFLEIFGRDPGGAMEIFETDDADAILVASATVATTARGVVERRRARGERVGLVTMRLFRPFPADALRAACSPAGRIGVLDRDYAAGVGGIWAQDVRAAFQGRGDRMIQDYLLGVGGGDVTPDLIERIVDDLMARADGDAPVWADLAETWTTAPAAEVDA